MLSWALSPIINSFSRVHKFDRCSCIHSEQHLRLSNSLQLSTFEIQLKEFFRCFDVWFWIICSRKIIFWEFATRLSRHNVICSKRRSKFSPGNLSDRYRGLRQRNDRTKARRAESRTNEVILITTREIYIVAARQASEPFVRFLII